MIRKQCDCTKVEEVCVVVKEGTLKIGGGGPYGKRRYWREVDEIQTDLEGKESLQSNL